MALRDKQIFEDPEFTGHIEFVKNKTQGILFGGEEMTPQIMDLANYMYQNGASFPVCKMALYLQTVYPDRVNGAALTQQDLEPLIGKHPAMIVAQHHNYMTTTGHIKAKLRAPYLDACNADVRIFDELRIDHMLWVTRGRKPHVVPKPKSDYTRPQYFEEPQKAGTDSVKDSRKLEIHLRTHILPSWQKILSRF